MIAKAVKGLRPKVKPSKKHGMAGDIPSTKNPNYNDQDYFGY